MRILLLNQYFPPDPAPTGMLLRELGDTLAADGHEVDFISARQDYRAGQRQNLRVLRELSAMARILFSGLAYPHPDLIISASSPPCLLIAATLISAWHKAKSIHWVMDLYPEIAEAMGVIRRGTALNILERWMGWCYRRCSSVVALDEDMAARLRRYEIKARMIRPWVPLSLTEEAQAQAFPKPVEPWTWIYSGNLGQAHEWETLLQAQQIIEQNDTSIRLLFQGGGPSWPAAQARARELGLKRCDFKPYVSRQEYRQSLLQCHCCAASQRPAAQGLLWPSKLSLLLTLPRPILWVGPAHGAISLDLRGLPHAGVFAPGEACEIAAWLVKLSHEKPFGIEPPSNAKTDRAALLAAWRSLVQEIITSRHGDH